VKPGAARLAVLTVPAALYFFSYFHRIAPAVVAADLMRAFGITAASLAVLSAVYPYMFVAMALVAGSLADGVGPRWTLALGGTTMAFGAALFGLAPDFGVAVAGRVLVGLGASVILVAWLSLIANWVRTDEFGTASGWTQTIGNAGALAASSPLALLVDAIGWRATFLVVGALTLLIACATLLLVRDRPAGAIAPGGRTPGVAGVVRGIRAIVTNPMTWPPAVAAAGIFATVVTLLGLWGVTWLRQVYGVTRVQAATTLAALALGIAVGSPAAGWLSDRWLRRRRPAFAALATVYALCWAPLLLTGGHRLPVSWLPVLFLLMGLAAGGFALVFSCIREVNDPARVGLAMGFCNIPIFTAFALLQSVSGVLLDARWEGLAVEGVRVYPETAYRAVFALCFATAVVSAVAAARIRETRCQNIWSTAPRDAVRT
jgi:MFS family permease